MTPRSSIASSSDNSIMFYGEKNDLGLTESLHHGHEQRADVEAGTGGALCSVKTAASKNGNPLTTTLSRGLSKVRTSDTLNPGPPPDGGVVAWTQAVASHFLIFTVWGFINSFGLFQSYYVDNMQIGSPSAVAWIGTVQVWIVFNLGIFSGRATDAGFFRLLYCCGAVLSLVGIFTLSVCKTYWQIFLAQGVCMGFGFGLMFVPTLTIVSTYFLKNRPTALGITVTGSATGGLVFPAIAQQMLPSSGFGWTVRTIGFVQMACLIGVGLVMKPRLPPRKSGPIVEWTALKESAYTLYLLCGFFFFWSVYTGFFYITSYARNVLGASQTTGINLLLAMNGVGVIGRLAVNTASTYTGPINMLFPFILASGVMGFAWIGVHNIAGLWAFTCVYGITSAALQGLWPVVLTSLTSDPKKAGVRAGMGFAWVGWAVLTGPPIAGALIETMNGRFLACQIFAGSTMFVAAALLAGTRWAVLSRRQVGWKLAVKV